MIPRFKKSRFEPKPIETDYWIDLNENEYGGVFKYYDNNAMVWKQTESITREREPLFTNSAAYTITTNDIDYWNSKVGIEDFDALKEEVLSLGSNEEYVTMETLKYYMDVIQGELGNIDLTVLDKIDDKADKSTTLAGYGIKDAYTKKEVDDKFTEWKVELPQNVSYFKNDAGYVTESNLESKLPDHIVSDENYVHTDNNFTDSYKNKLDNISEDLKAVAYDDTELRQLISGIDTKIDTEVDSLSTKVDQDINSAVNTLTEQIQTKANIDDVYTKAYLDEVHSQFVRKTHSTYGFIDERPLDLEVTDTGHVFYDYTVNEALIWVADEWRVLRSNEALENFILDEDIDETGIGMWEFELGDDTRFCRLTKYIGEYTSTMDLVIPNLYIKYFTLELGKDPSSLIYKETFSHFPDYVATYTSLLDESTTISRYVISKKENITIYPTEKQSEEYSSLEIHDVFGNVVAKASTSGTNNTHPYTPIASDKVLVNTFKISQGIKKINDCAFILVNASSNNDLVIPSGVETIGNFAFYKSSITSVEFPRNPIKFGVYAFSRNPITKVTFPKTLDWDSIKKGDGLLMFSTCPSTMEVDLKEGVKAIPISCFYNTVVSSIKFPDSLEWIGSSAFYNSKITGSFESKKIKTLESWAFKDNRFDSIQFDESINYIAPYAFYCYISSGYHPCTSINVPLNVEELYEGSFPSYLGNCGVPIITSPKLKNLPPDFGWYYGGNINSVNGTNKVLDIPIVLSEGLKSIDYRALYYSCVTGNLVLPESLKYIASGAFGKCFYLENTSLRIPKNVQIIGGQSDADGAYLQGRNDIMESDELYKHWPITKNGYSMRQFYNYIEDGGNVSNYGDQTFYQFGRNTMKTFEVDEDNQWFKAVDGVLYSKDGTRLVGYPCAKGVSTYEVPEGCVYFDSKVFTASGYKWTYTYTDNTDTEVTFYPGYKNGTNNLENQTYSGENPLREVILPNTIINYTPEELRELFPTAWLGDSCNMLTASSWYYCGIEKFTVKDDNPNYKNVDDWLLSKDGTTLETIPGGMKGTHRLPDTVTTIKPGAFYCTNSSGCESEREAAQIASAAKYADYPGGMYMGLNIIIPPSVVNMTDLTLFSLNNLNRFSHSSVTFEDGNPAFTYNSETGNYERV